MTRYAPYGFGAAFPEGEVSTPLIAACLYLLINDAFSI
jgi:hypothetical protein